MRQRFTAIEYRRVHSRVLMYVQRTVAAIGRRNRLPSAAPRSRIEMLSFVARRNAFHVRFDPDLQKMHRLIGRIAVLAVPDAGAGAHALDVAVTQRRTIAHAVAM